MLCTDTQYYFWGLWELKRLVRVFTQPWGGGGYSLRPPPPPPEDSSICHCSSHCIVFVVLNKSLFSPHLTLTGTVTAEGESSEVSSHEVDPDGVRQEAAQVAHARKIISRTAGCFPQSGMLNFLLKMVWFWLAHIWRRPQPKYGLILTPLQQILKFIQITLPIHTVYTCSQPCIRQISWD